MSVARFSPFAVGEKQTKSHFGQPRHTLLYLSLLYLFSFHRKHIIAPSAPSGHHSHPGGGRWGKLSAEGNANVSAITRKLFGHQNSPHSRIRIIMLVVCWLAGAHHPFPTMSSGWLAGFRTNTPTDGKTQIIMPNKLFTCTLYSLFVCRTRGD